MSKGYARFRRGVKQWACESHTTLDWSNRAFVQWKCDPLSYDASMGRCWGTVALLALCACKAELAGGPEGDEFALDGSVNAIVDSSVDTITPSAWSAPAKVVGASSGADEDDGTLSSNELELYFKRVDNGDPNLYVMTRASTTSAWGAPTALGVLNTTQTEESPRLSMDDLRLYFGRNGDIFVSTRTAVGQPWQTATTVGTLNTTANEKWAAVCSNGYVVVSRGTTNNGQDLYEGTITGGANTSSAALNSAGQDQGTFISDDCLTVYFQSNRTNAQFDIYASTRVATNAPWPLPTIISDFNTTTSSEEDPWVSKSKKTFVFTSNASGSKDIYISTR